MAGAWTADLLAGVAGPEPAEAADRFRNESAWTVYLHDDFFEWFADEASPAQAKRARFNLRELLVSGACARRKTVQGAAKGWMRTQLGGGGGSHYYLWWAPHGYPPLDGRGLEEGAVLVRAVRHHDDTDRALDAGIRADWHVVDADFVHDNDDSDLTEEQQAAAAPEGAPIRFVKGHPGSGKTTALLQAGSHRWGPKVLYLTLSNKLASAAEQYFQTFAPLEVSVDALTFGELLVELGADPSIAAIAGAPQLGPRRIADHLEVVRGQLGPWANRPAELYAELHANAVGRALPFEFRGLPGTEGAVVPSSELSAARADTLGAVASERMAFAAHHLDGKGSLDELFPTVRAARTMLDRSDDELPARFEDASAVLVDEVQDLTVVEAALVLLLVARIGRSSGRMPQLIVAGDEAQTVRPTGFRWAWLGSLVELVFGEDRYDRSEVSLTANMRSPRSIAALIEATRRHYRILDKADRPAGLKYTEADQDHEGRVLYCHAPRDEDWASLAEVFEAQPSAQLVYPGSIVPEELEGTRPDVASSAQVKGLDFDLVGVVDAGRRQVELEDLAAKADDDPLAGALGRTHADEFRVAVSRARENLVLIDRGREDLAPAIAKLVEDVEPDPVVRVDVEGLAAQLDGEVDPIDRLDAQLSDVRDILEDDPRRALVKARTATDLLRRAAAVDVPRPMAIDTHRLCGLAAALTALLDEAEGDRAAARAHRAEAADQLAEAGFGPAYAAHSRLRDEAGREDLHLIAPDIVRAATASHQLLLRELPQLEPRLRTNVAGWLRAVAEHGLPLGDALEAGIAANEAASEIFVHRQPELVELRDTTLHRTARTAADLGAYEDALRCYEELEQPEVDEVGPCLEALGRWGDAANLYEGEGRLADALRCVREVPDLPRALTMAQQVAPEVEGRLRWAIGLSESVRPALVDEGAPLTEAERSHLLALVDDGTDRATRSEPTAGAAVDRIGAHDEPEPGRASAPAVLEGPAEEEAAEPRRAVATDGASEGELVETAALARDLGMGEDELLDLCRRLGIRAVGEPLSVTSAQAGRVRRRLAGSPGG